ncbi:AraC family transcriptional regulator [Gluconobacter thailandicus]|uniref:helix-turn-helix domain-containing protein n=1 Tax=Gluconobacter thailandicus TaxID=257438 RepID=UPI000777A60A|nr:AraC family transcriptional regulator [Gluconobacter thailandicus]KXV36019.1 AraC family transcriptional regulator [Gluconobacter thailandicus]
MGDFSRRAGHLHDARRHQKVLPGLVVSSSTYQPSLTIDRHDHELASLCVVISGGYHETYGYRSRDAVPGMLIAHPPGEHHADQHLPCPTRILTIEVSHEVLQDHRTVFADAHDRIDPRAVGLGMKLARMLAVPCRSHDIEMESVIVELLALGRHVVMAGTKGARWLNRVRDHLEAYPEKALTISELAEIAAVHPVHLARSFRKTYGCSIGDYVRQLRIGRALCLLGDPHLELVEIAALCGFSDQSHMTRQIKGMTGLPPGRVRRTLFT